MYDVLIVEDDPDIRTLVTRALGREGFTSRAVATAAEALAAIQARMPDAIITDVRLPGPSGFSLLEDLRAHQETARIPVLVMTGSHDRALAAAVDQAGRALFVGKPFTIDELVSGLRALLAT